MFDPLWDSPAGEERQQLIVSALWLTPPRRRFVPPPRLRTSPEIFWDKRLLIKAQALENGANGKMLYAVNFFFPYRGTGAEEGSLQLSKLDKFLERVLGRIPRPGTFELSELIGVNFVATVTRERTRYNGEYHPISYFEVEEPDCCRLYADWPAYSPNYTTAEREKVFVPPELAGAKL